MNSQLQDREQEIKFLKEQIKIMRALDAVNMLRTFEARLAKLLKQGANK